MSNFKFDLIEQILFKPLYSRIEVSSFNPTCSTSSTTKPVSGQCVTELKSSQQTSPCTNSLSNLSVTLRVLMSIWTSERKLHHSPSKQEMLSSSEGNLHFVCIKRWEYIWTHQKTTLGPITHNTNILSCTFWKFLLSVARPIKVSGLLWVDSVLTVLISWAANAGLTNVSLLSLSGQLPGTRGCWKRDSKSVWLHFQCTWLSGVFTACLFWLTVGFAPLTVHSFCSHLINCFTN